VHNLNNNCFILNYSYPCQTTRLPPSWSHNLVKLYLQPNPNIQHTSWPSSTDTEGWIDTPVKNNTISVSSTIDVCSTIEVDGEEKKGK